MPANSDDWTRGDPRASRRLGESLRLLCICRREPSWTGLALQLDRLGCSEPRFQWCSTQSAAATLLREQGFDVILIGEPSPVDTDPLVFLTALREAGTEETALIVSACSDDAWLLRCGELNAEVFPAQAGWDSRALAVWIRRAQDRRTMECEHQRLLLADRRQTSEGREGRDAVLRRIQQIVDAEEPRPAPLRISPDLRRRYEELLRTHVFFGAGRLHDEITRLSGTIETTHLPAVEILRLHCECLESLLKGCGSRSVRHLQQNADLFALEVLMRLADGYRRKSQRQGLGDHGIDLLHADSLRQKNDAG